MNFKSLNIAIILGSTREGRVSPQVGQWVLKASKDFPQATFEVVDIKSFKLPLLGESNETQGIEAWNKKLFEFDGFIFVVAEYNHSVTGALKNAIDLARDAWMNKAAGIVSYGSAGGARAAEHLRTILGELQIADVRSHTLLSLFTDFSDGKFTPQSLHQTNLNEMFKQLLRWSQALKSIREEK